MATTLSITVAGSLLTEKYSSFCTCSVRVLCELGSRKGMNRRSKEDRTVISTSKMGGATVMLALQLRVPFSPKKHPSFCTCSVRVLCEFGSERGANHRSKEGHAAI